jgi:protocatechuate 3,4-dioxygenase beta subunit
VTAIELGDIVLGPGVCLRARVVDEDDRPVPGIAVQLQRADADAAGRFGPATTATAESDARGAFAIEGLAGGAWTVLPRHVERIHPVGDLVLAAGQNEQHVTIVVRPPDPRTTITGSVVDADGSPVAGAQVAAEGGPVATAQTDERGAFQLVRTDAAAGPVQLRVRGAAGHEDLLTPWMPWGSRSVTLALQRAGGMVVTVVELGTARAVEDFGVSWCRVEEAAAGHQGAQGAVVHHAGGTATIDGVPRGRIRLVVTPADAALAPSDQVEIQHHGGGTAVRGEQRRCGELPVRVTLADGRPVQGAALELIRPPAGARVDLETYCMDPGRPARLAAPHTHAVRLDETTTDETGRAVLRAAVDGSLLAIRLPGPGHQPVVVHGIVVDPRREPVEITVRTGATLSGTVRPAWLLAGLREPALVLTYQGGRDPSRGHARRTVPLQPSGAFRCTGLQAGTWGVLFRGGSDPGLTGNVTTKQFAPVVLAGDAHVQIECELGDVAPAVLRGCVVLDGAAAVDRQVELVRVATAGDGRTGRVGTTRVVTDAHGAFVAAGLPPGRYFAAVTARHPGTRGHVELTCGDPVDVAPGAAACGEFRIRSGRLEIEVRNAAGEPLARRQVVVHDVRSGFRAAPESDADGVVRIDPIAAGTYAIRVAELERDPAGPLTEVAVVGGPSVTRTVVTVGVH